MGKAKEWESELGPFMAKDVKSAPRWSKARVKREAFVTPPRLLTKDKPRAIVKHKELGEIPKQRVGTNRKETEMQKTIKAQKYAALAALASGSIYGITRYSSDTVVIVLGTLLVALLVEKSIK